MPSVYIQSSVFLPTPSGGAGAVELLVAKMAEGLAKRGWFVRLFALAGSHVEGAQTVMVPAEGSAEEREARLVEAMGMGGEPDVVFDHSMLMLAGRKRGPYVAMSHGMAPLPSWAHNVVFTSQHHGRLHGRKDPQALLLGIDLADIPQATAEKRQGLFWAGRIMPYKRLHLACEIARLAGMRLRVAGPVVDEQYWRHICATYLTPAVGEPVFTYLGELPRETVLQQMSRSRYFLFTSDETEPAGLTMLESQACGTPVIAVNGPNAAEEYIGRGVSGMVAWDAAEAARFVTDDTFTSQFVDYPKVIRGWVESRFTIDHMVDRAEDYLRRAIAGERW